LFGKGKHICSNTLEKLSCLKPSFSNRYQQYKSLNQAIESEEKAAQFQTNFETAFKDTVLFHGTQPENVISILEHGLVCVINLFLNYLNNSLLIC